MSLRTKIFIVLAPSVLLLSLALFALLSYQMMDGYDRVETNYTRENVARTLATMQRQALSELCRADWSAWDDMYQFVEDRNSEFVKVNISPQTFVDLSVDTIAIVNAAGQVTFARSYDADTLEEVPVAKDLLDEIKPGSYFLQHAEPLAKSSNWGLLTTSEGVFSIGSTPILTSAYEGPARGSLIFARKLHKDRFEALGKQLTVECTGHLLSDPLPASIKPIAEQLRNSDHGEQEVTIALPSNDRIAGFVELNDIHGRDAVLLEVTTPRHIHRQAEIERRNFALSFSAVGATFLVGLFITIELFIVVRLRRLSGRVREIRSLEDWSARLVERGGDELACLAHDVNALMSALSESIKKEDEKDKRFRMLSTHAPVGMFETNRNGECQFVNPSWCDITGLTPEQAAGLGWQKAIHPDDLEMVVAAVSEKVPIGEPFEFETRLLRTKGDIRYVRTNAVPLRDTSGKVYACFGTIMDISDIRNAERELRENEKRYRGIIELQAELVCRYRPDTTLTYVNDAYCVYFGKQREELIGKSYLEVLPSEMPIEDVILDLRNASGPVTTRHRVVTESGDEQWQEWEDTPIRDAEGNVVEFQAVGRDITERKRAEDALRESEAKLRSITSSVADAVIMMDEDGLVSFWNEAAERTFGYTRMEILGRPLHDIIAPERYRAAFHKNHSKFIETGTGPLVGQTIEIQGKRKDGSEFPVELTIAACRFGGAWHAVGTARDITDRKLTEQQIDTYARTLEAANAQLEEAIGQANQLALEAQVASVAKSDFVANMSHEIRTPLNGIIGMTTLLLDTSLSSEQREFAETVRMSGEALLCVVNDILDFSKIEAGKMDIETIEFNLRAAIEQIGDMLAPRAQEKGLQFSVLVHHDVPECVMGDPGRLRQVLLNLAGNALKFTERGEIVISARLQSSDGEKAIVLFEVSDSGIGIPQERVNALFQPFTQVDSSTTRKYGGTGLGLTISKRLCEAMGGEISVRSTVGQGSTFGFTAAFECAASPDRATPPNLSSLAGMRVLVVEANATGRTVYRELLRDQGVSVSECLDAEEAYTAMRDAAANAVPFTVVLVDHFQPRLDAASFAAQVKSDPVLTRTRLLLVTSWPKRGDAAEMAKHGYEGYLTKPVKRRHLLEAVAAVGMREGTAQSNPAPLVTQHSLNEANRGRTRILLVEDNIINQKVATRILEKIGYRCDVASNGREAVEAAMRVEYDVILMDCQMPEMDGYEATRAIRQHEGDRRHTAIIALTASAMRTDHELCYEVGMDDILTKPINVEELQEKLEACLLSGPPVRPMYIAPAETAPTQNPVDLDRLSEITMGDPDLETELIVTFLADTAQRISELAHLITSGDATLMGSTAHALKGSAGNMGATALQDIAYQLEMIGRSGDIGEAPPAYESLKAEADRVKEYLSGYMQA